MRWTQVLLWLALLAGLGSFLTLLSGFHIRRSQMFSDTVPTRYMGLEVQFGFPIPFILVELWSDSQLGPDALFTWEGALLDMTFYASIIGIALWIRSEIAGAIKARKSSVDE